MSTQRIVADGYYIPTLPDNPGGFRYRLKIYEMGFRNVNYAYVRIRIPGSDACHFRETGQVRFVGDWQSVAPQTISSTGGGLCYFDMQSNLMLLGQPQYTSSHSGPDVWDIQTVMGIGSILRVATFRPGDKGTGTQFANPCSGSTCPQGSSTSGPIHPGRIRWECVPEPTPMGP